jgi:hypothetical protein
VPGGYKWATVPLGDINIGTWSFRLEVGPKANDVLLQNPKKLKPDAMWQNLLSKAVV